MLPTPNSRSMRSNSHIMSSSFPISSSSPDPVSPSAASSSSPGRQAGWLSQRPHHHHRGQNRFSSDPGFAERAAKFSSFSSSNGNTYNSQTPYALGPDGVKPARGSRSITAADAGGDNVVDGKLSGSSSCSRLAKLAPSSIITSARRTSHGAGSSSAAATAAGGGGGGDDTNVKRQRSSGESSAAREVDAKLLRTVDRTLSESYSGESSPLSMQQQESPCKPSEPPPPPKQDYIHVRARRGQATDSHSLAERVRREKISERMKFLQDLVPGCSKVTGKAVMLDEIINYVQSLQRQIEFLSMKLAAVNPGMDCTVDDFLCKQMQGSTAPMMMGPDTTTMSYGHHHPQSQQQQVHNLQTVGHSGLDFKPLESSAEASLGRTMSAPVIAPVSSLDAFGDNLSQLSSGWEGELQSVVNMGFLQGRLSTWLPQESHCQMQAGKMKVEL
ncbi:unnamed protein product [Sphagnum jensenii]|uniref:BHLH domain-containing protein n=1 Tax=Sphagnum jensenii TaxID=128206 RepID=A0ABP1BLD9_9BRYO